MSYDFTTHVSRRGVGSEKWEMMLRENPSVPEDVVPLSIADMELLNPPEVRQALHDLVDAGPLGYTGPTRRFFDACCGWQRRRHGWDPQADWIVTSPGVVPALFRAVESLTEPGDGVIIQPPVYHPFRMAIEANGRRVVENPLVKCPDGRYVMDLEDLAAKASDPRATMLILCSPANPVGRVWTAEELRALIDICRDNDVLLVSDEIHNDLVMPGHAHTTVGSLMDAPELDRVVVCTAPSKTFNLAGVQASVIYIPNRELRERFVGGRHSSLNIFAYTATAAAYEGCEAWLEELLGLIDTNFRVLADWARTRHPELTVTPLEGTYLAWVDFGAWGLTDEELERFMRDEALLWLDEGTMFGRGGEGHERFNLACPTDVVKSSLARLDAAWAARQGAAR